MNIKILLTCVGGELMPFLIKYLKKMKNFEIYLVGTDMDDGAIGKYFCDKFYRTHRGNSSKYLADCKKIVIKEKINLIIPTSDEEALALSKNKEIFSKLGATVACVEYKTLRVLNNKFQTYKEFSKKKLPVSHWENIKDFEDLTYKIKYFKKEYGSFVLKPKEGRGSKDIYIFDKDPEIEMKSKIKYIKNEKQFLKKVENKKNFHKYIIMKKLMNPVVDLDMLSWNGKAISIIPRKRIHPTFPNMGHKILYNSDLIALGKKIIKAFKLSWLYDCDIMFDENNNPSIIEINPRQSGSISVSVAAGYRIFDNLLRLYLGKKTLKEHSLKETIVIPFKDLSNF